MRPKIYLKKEDPINESLIRQFSTLVDLIYINQVSDLPNESDDISLFVFSELSNSQFEELISTDFNFLDIGYGKYTLETYSEEIKNILKLEKLTIIVPTQDIEIFQFTRLFNSLKDKDYIKQILLITTRDVFLKSRKLISKNKLIKYIEVENGTKVSKLKIANDFIENDDYILVLDGDDILNENFVPSYWGYDLFFSDYLRFKINKKKIIKKQKVFINENSLSWGNGGQPYFGNHSIIVRGEIFLKVNKEIIGTNDFQRHEDAFRSLYYISYSNKIHYSNNEFNIPINRLMSEEFKHTSRIKDNLEIADWILTEINLIKQNTPNFSNIPLYRKSQIASINEINSSLLRLKDKNLIDKKIEPIEIIFDQREQETYGKLLLDYNFKEINNIKYTNLGDFAQSIAVKDLLKMNFDDVKLVNREGLDNIGQNKRSKLIVNGWFSHNSNIWPFDNYILPKITSFHLKRNLVLSDDQINFLKSKQPIGCRDLDTVRKLRELKIRSYFSGCMTMSIKKRNVKKEGLLFIIDNIKVDSNGDAISTYGDPGIITFKDFSKWRGSKFIIKQLRKSYSRKKIKNAEFLTQFASKDIYGENAFNLSEKLLDHISKKELVVTTRIHTLMPAMSMGTPALFIMINNDDHRFKGLMKFWNYIDFSEPETFNKKRHVTFPVSNKPLKVKIQRNKNGILNDERFRILIQNEISDVIDWWHKNV